MKVGDLVRCSGWAPIPSVPTVVPQGGIGIVLEIVYPNTPTPDYRSQPTVLVQFSLSPVYPLIVYNPKENLDSKAPRWYYKRELEVIKPL